MSYALYAVILKIFVGVDSKISFLSDIFSKSSEFNYMEVFNVTLVAIITVVIYSFFVNKKVLYNINRYLEKQALICVTNNQTMCYFTEDFINFI